jgi:hypothetical protein
MSGLGLEKISAIEKRRQLQREAACLPHAALHFLHARLEVRVAGIDVAPGVEDRDHGLAAIVGLVQPQLRHARAVVEACA